MNCETYAEWMSAQLDGELAADHAIELDRHLAGCESCQKTRQTMARLAVDIHNLPRHQPDDSAVIAVNEAVHQLALAPRRSDFGPVLDLDELAEFLRVTPETIGTYLDELPSFELGGKLLFRRASVEKWIERREQSILPTEPPHLSTARRHEGIDSDAILPALDNLRMIRMN